MIGFLVLALIIGICSAIYWGIWNGTRTKIEKEDEKIEYLESKFEFLKDFSFDKETPSSNLDPVRSAILSRILSLLNQNGFKKGIITSVDCALPHNENKPWKVYLTVKSGTWPFTDKEEQIEIYTISDKVLSEVDEYINYLKHK
tara:strand:- start:152 stop:583 length:432 start_codon:yes stop_codon:yes gene_type:complete